MAYRSKTLIESVKFLLAVYSLLTLISFAISLIDMSFSVLEVTIIILAPSTFGGFAWSTANYTISVVKAQ